MSPTESRRRWATRMIRRSPEPPTYGSSAWLALPGGSPAKVAAVIVAAEAWARAGDELEDQLRTEVELSRHAHKQAEDEAYWASYAAHREWVRDGTGRYARIRRARAALMEDRGAADFPGTGIREAS